MALASRARLIAPAVCAAALLTVAAGLAIGHLGTDLPPFMLRWQPKVDRHAWVAIAVITGACTVAPASVGWRWRGWRFAALLYVVALALGLGVNLAHEGVRGWWAMFATGRHGSFEGEFEYLLGLPLLRHGVGYYLHHFPALLYYATTHIKGNPPGPLVLLHLLGIHTAAQLAALCIVCGSACAPLAYDLGRTLGGEERGRVAGWLCACSPAALLYGVSSFDYLFAALGMAALCLLARPGGRALAAGAAIAAVGTFFSYLLFAIPAFAALLALQRSGWRRALEIGAACAAAVVALNLALFVAYGYDPFAAVQATLSAYHAGAAAGRPYAFWLFGSPAAWIVMLGLPIAWFALQGLTRRDAACVTLWTMVLTASVLGVTKAETERIWLPFVPIAAVAAAAVVPASRLRPAVTFLLVQALAVELLLFTIW